MSKNNTCSIVSIS